VTVVEHEIRLLVLQCGRCGGTVVGDNTGNGRPWQHVDRPDDHHVIFGTPAPEGIIAAPTGLAALEEILEEDEDVTAGLPAGGKPRRAHPDELGNGKSGVMQMINAATKAGFTHEATVCVGPSKIAAHHDPRGYRLVESLLVGFKHTDGRAAIGIWERLTEKEGAPRKFILAFVKGGAGGIQGSPELKAYLKGAA
jgi:hypothetical protein